MTSDALVRRLARGATLFCATAAGLMLALTRDWAMALGVIGGGALVGVSLLAIRSSVDALIGVMTGMALTRGDAAPDVGQASAPADPPVGAPAVPASQARRRAAGALVRLVGRYALLAVMAYVMIARLRLHPIGLLIGASSLVASAALEAVRVLTRARAF